MAITGYTFDRAKVTSGSDSSLYNYLSGLRDGVILNRGNGMNVYTNGLTCVIETGQALIQGRLVEVTAPENVTIPAYSTGYLCITIDLSQINTSTGTPGQSDYAFVLGQLKTEFVETLTNQDLLNGGTIYNFNLGSVSSTGTSVTYTKNWNTYTPSFIFPYGAVFGNSITDYGSALLGNRWYADTDNLYIEPQANKRAIVRQVGTSGTSTTYLPIQASRFIGADINPNVVPITIQDLFLEPSTSGGKVVVRLKDTSGTSTTYLPIQASRFIAPTSGNLFLEPNADSGVAIVRKAGTGIDSVATTYLPIQASRFLAPPNPAGSDLFLEPSTNTGSAIVRQTGTGGVGTVYLPIKAKNFVAPNDTTGWVNFTLESNFVNNTTEPYANTAAYRCTGNIVLIKAGITAPSSVTYSSGTSYPVFTIPSAHRPSYKVSTTVNGILSDLADPITTVFYFVIDSTSGTCYLRPTRTVTGKNIYINIHINYLLLP